jgi:hypothetical protein
MTDYKCQNGDVIRVGGVYQMIGGCTRDIVAVSAILSRTAINFDDGTPEGDGYCAVAFASELPRDADGYYSWTGEDCPVPLGWVVECKTISGGVPTHLARDFNWECVLAFKVISTGEMDVAINATTDKDHITEAFHALESDPSGIDQYAAGAKLDAGKNRLGLVLGAFSRALTCVGKVGTYGANKYTDNGWLSVERGQERYTDALYRHLLKEASGEECDQGTNIYHAAHSAWNALARLELIIREAEALERGE